ncbi:unnamed protein product [Arctogadus glacialis]
MLGWAVQWTVCLLWFLRMSESTEDFAGESGSGGAPSGKTRQRVSCLNSIRITRGLLSRSSSLSSRQRGSVPRSSIGDSLGSGERGTPLLD